MNLARAILEGIHEVELQVTPEFQKEWPPPKVWSRSPAGIDSSGYARYHTVFMWPNKAVVEGLEIFKPADHEFNAWAPKSKVESGSWASAMRSIKATGRYPGGIYVYVESEEDPMYDEINQAATDRAIKALASIDKYEPGDEPVVDHFLGYEAVPASEQPTGPTWGVPLEQNTKLVLVNRTWMHVTHPNADVTESNPVMVLTKHLPFEVLAQSKAKIVKATFEGLGFQASWSAKLEAWRIWPGEGQNPKEFNDHLVVMLQHIDGIIDAAEET